jgi:GNAT superfamily N-acetyltransferase
MSLSVPAESGEMIRRGEDADVEALYAMERAASSAGLAHVFGSLPFPDDDVLARWRLVLGDASATVLVDEQDGVPVGYAAFGDGWLRHFAVVPGLWGTGRSSALHAAVVERSAAAGVPTKRLWVLVDNHRARAFYRRLGWHDTDVRERETFAPYPLKMQMHRVPGG